jgi:DNA helicase II / ATP-dependent DNA helicase PcrA
VAHLIERGVPPSRILLLTFTRRSAQEMLARAEKLVGHTSRGVHGGTFHGTAHRLLRRFGPEGGLPARLHHPRPIRRRGPDGSLAHALGLGDKTKRFPKKETLHHVYSRHVNTDYPVGAILRDEYPRFVEFEDDFARVFADYTQRKQQRDLVDYDDLLLYWALAARASTRRRRQDRGLYDHILVDEYQDTNVLQARILKGMCRMHRNLTVVGDDAQSIYAFRGATIRNILDFPRDYAGASTVTLEENYRSTQPILDATNLLISRAEERFSKELYTKRTGGEKPWLVTAQDEQQQTRFVVDRILELHEEGVPLREMAVLFRAGYMSADLEIELTARNIPFDKWGGLKFLEAAHVKDVLAFLRVLENPRDEVSWYRLLLLMPGIGDSHRTQRRAINGRSRVEHESFGRFNAAARAGRPTPRSCACSPTCALAATTRTGASAARSSACARCTTTSCASATTASSRGSPTSISCRPSPAATRTAALPERARPRAAERHQRPRLRWRRRGRHAHALDRAQLQGPRVGCRVSSSGRWTAGSRWPAHSAARMRSRKSAA